MPECWGNKFNWIAASHELVETVTDPLPDPGTTITVGRNAWVTKDSYEIADICRGGATIKGADGELYTVQYSWSNKYNTCLVEHPPST
jgi:hypothetical protein